MLPVMIDHVVLRIPGITHALPLLLFAGTFVRDGHVLRTKPSETVTDAQRHLVTGTWYTVTAELRTY